VYDKLISSATGFCLLPSQNILETSEFPASWDDQHRASMSAYAILGATRQVGGSILSVLGGNPSARIHVLVRSRAKLEKSYPGLNSNPNIIVYEGTVTDIPLLTACLANTHSIFLTVAVTENKPGVKISVETAHAVVSALQSLRTTRELARYDISHARRTVA
jgi:hypothetical protein